MSSTPLLLFSLLLIISLPYSNGDDKDDLCTIAYEEPTTEDMCMLLEAYVTLEITYNQTNTSLPPLTSSVQLGNCSSDVTYSIDYQLSSCGSKDNNTNTILVVDWSNGVSLSFQAMPTTSKQWNISMIAASVNTSSTELFPDTRNKTGVIEGYTKGKGDYNSLFGTLDYGNYYLCNSYSSFDLTMNTTGNKYASLFKMKLTIGDLSIQAYNPHGRFNTSKYSECYQDHGGKAFIPIVVGSVIGGLVLVVLVSYIVGRFRNHYKSKSGYEKL